MDGGADEVVEAPYCCVCRRSCDVKWKKHVFSKAHQRAIADFLSARVQEWTTMHQRIEQREVVGEQEAAYHCAFCELKADKWIDVVEHLASSSHHKCLNAFCGHHRGDPQRTNRQHLMLQRSDYHKLLRLLTPDESKDKAVQDDPPLAPVVQSAQTEAFLVSAAARLHEVQTRRPDNETPTASAPTQSVMGPQTHSLIKARTVVSPDGVLQNPLGRHEGKRVWGGGVVKVKKMEWIPWGIDRLVLAEDEHGLGDARAADTSAPTLRVTEAARGDGLNSIQRVYWGGQVANIHTAAVPPWMVASEEEYRRCNQRNVNIEPTAPGVEHSSSTKPERRDTPSKPSKPGARDIFDRLNPQYDEKTWLPNFGGVWQEGPRSKTKREFKKTVRQQVKPPSTLPDPAPLRSSMENKPASDAPATTQETSQTPTAQVPDKLDAKKQLLLAQKERLRAKLAAKRKT